MLNKLFKQLKQQWGEDYFYTRSATFFAYKFWLYLDRQTMPVRRHATNLSVLAFVAVISTYVLFPTVANADMENERMPLDEAIVGMIISSMQNETEPFGILPVAEDATPRHTYTIPMTAYTSEVWQTDDTPCITASGLDLCERGVENVVAANFLPLGTRVRIPELFGDRVFYVEDRMNKRYQYKMDVWMLELEDAREFGVKYATVEVF
ncbi:MAG: 3D domain-containing protein [Parcubacteria group bacterium]|nr:3D domain-containing protein [Parcubacteria group bacterium]